MVKLYLCNVLGFILMVILLFGVDIFINDIVFNCNNLFLIFWVMVLSLLRGMLLVKGILIIFWWNLICEIWIGFMFVGKVVMLFMWSLILLSILFKFLLGLIFNVIVLLFLNVWDMVCFILVIFLSDFFILMKIFFLIFCGEVSGYDVLMVI